jgi:sugar/nucleoside kinase (ribokinase family)
MPAAAELDVLVVGDLNADFILRGDTNPRFGQIEQLLDDANLTLGSSSAICACGLAGLGLQVGFIGKVGDDELGRFVVRALAARGVEVSGVVIEPTLKTGVTIILNRDDDRAMLTFPGALRALRLADIPETALTRARHLHLGGYFLLDALRPDAPALFATARWHELTVSLDTNDDPQKLWAGLDALWPLVNVFLPNEAELRAITGQAEVDAALAALVQRGPGVAVKLGANGAAARFGAESARAKSLPIEVVDTVGAGDSFDAGFIYAYLANWELPRALRLAAVCGALSTRAVGGTAAQPTLDEALALL